MSDDLRERVARAIFDASTFYGEWNRQPEATREVCFAMADAALAEMGEPAPASVREAARVALERFESCASGMVPDDYARGYREACEHIRAIAEGKVDD